MTRLIDLHERCGQSPWLDNIRRGWITGGELQRWVDGGVRGLTSNPSIFQNAITSSADYDHEFRGAIRGGLDIEQSYWRLVTSDIVAAAEVLRPVHDASNGVDGYVSVEVSPALARDTAATIDAARELHRSIAAANLYVKIPGTLEGLDAIETMIAERRSINVTLIFSVARYMQVAEAYLSGLERAQGDLSGVSSVASFFISRIDTEVDRRLDDLATPAASALRGRTAIACAKVAYDHYQRLYSGARWERLAARGARPQRLLWASTSTKDPSYPDTLYVDELIGPDTVNTLPDNTLAAFEDHGTVTSTLPLGLTEAQAHLEAVAACGIDMAEVASKLEDQGVAAFSKSFDELIGALGDKAALLDH